MDEKHHIVPRFLLQRFADGDRIVMMPRDGGDAIVTSVSRAGREGAFYALDPDPEFEASEEFRSVEQLLSMLEGVAQPILEKVSCGEFPLTADDDRFHLAMFMGVQLVRGWAGRDDFEELIDRAIKGHLRPKMSDHVNEWANGLSKAPTRSQIERFLKMEGVRIHVNRNWALGMMLKVGVEGIAPFLFDRPWRLYEFPSRMLVTSDEPLGLYVRPDRDLYLDPVGPASADAVYFPIDPTHALALLAASPSSEAVVEGDDIRARAINLAVARRARRWIFRHPDATPLEGLEIPPRPIIRDERVAMEDYGDRIVETRRLYRA